MRRLSRRGLGPAVAAVLLTQTLSAVAAPEQVQFNRDVVPILAGSCFTCHGPDRARREAGLRLDQPDGLAESWIVVPGEPEQSELLLRVIAEDPLERMPPQDSPHDPLSESQVETLRRWIEQGGEYQPHWAFVPPQRTDPPPADSDDAHWIDRYVLAELDPRRWTLNEEADRATLIRRLSFDLRGLPPGPDEVAAFLDDERPDAYERLVDRFLESPRFGERMAVYWLDLVRYADTVGYHGDQGHHASPYRDWVIDAFNDNMPYDRFTIEQLAGDLLEGELLEGSGVDRRIASAYNRLLQTSHEGGIQDAEYRAIQQADRVRNASSVWLGVTLGCAQCHDHVYDPFSIEDFYKFAAFFADIDERGDWSKISRNTDPTHRPPEIEVLTARQRGRIAAIDRELEALDAELEQVAADHRDELQQRIDRLRNQREEIGKDKRRVMVTVALKQPRETRVLPRGDWMNTSGAVVEPAIPAVFGELETEERATRLDLARWLVADDNPLTARVHVNRLWYLMFGHGLSRVLDDLGFQGEWPTHPKLLDALAVEFVESGWDTKHMLRLMATSRAYRRSSRVPEALREADPHNRLLARQTRLRLPAEFIRDQALAVAGLLDDEIGGPSVKPRQPDGYYSQLNFPTREYRRSTDAGQYRRGLYMHWQRTYLHPSLLAFDAPTREECVATRPESNTPLAALVLLNDPNFVEFARVFAQRMLEDGPDLDDRDRIERAFLRTLSRPPREQEVDLLHALLERERADYAEAPEAAAELVAVGDFPRPEELDPVEHAAWTAVARALLNLDETITRH